jgi:2-methylcitrate dehydratase PrpD
MERKNNATKTMQRKKHSAEFKAKIALEAAKRLKTKMSKIPQVFQ